MVYPSCRAKLSEGLKLGRHVAPRPPPPPRPIHNIGAHRTPLEEFVSRSESPRMITGLVLGQVALYARLLLFILMSLQDVALPLRELG